MARLYPLLTPVSVSHRFVIQTQSELQEYKFNKNLARLLVLSGTDANLQLSAYLRSKRELFQSTHK